MRRPTCKSEGQLHIFSGFTEAKNPTLPFTNEDQVVAVPAIGFAVIDGATDISGKRFTDRLGAEATGGRLAAQAIAEAFRLRFSAPGPLPDPQALAATATAAVRDLYGRLGLSDVVQDNSDLRFRAGFVAAITDGSVVRLVKVGDCGIRVDGRQVLDKVFPGDIVLSAARAHGYALLRSRGYADDAIRSAARQMIVDGLADAAPERTEFSRADKAGIRAAVLADAEVNAVLADQGRIAMLLDAGLSGIRADTAGFDALVIDGVVDVSPVIQSLDVPMGSWRCIELHSDGYPSIPEAMSVEAWEAALAEADRIDPERVGPYRSTKGRVGANFGDDRSILIIERGNPK